VNLSRIDIKHVVVGKPCTAKAVEKSNRMEKEALLALRRAVWEQCEPRDQESRTAGYVCQNPRTLY
jgi:hypothetical protein